MATKEKSESSTTIKTTYTSGQVYTPITMPRANITFARTSGAARGGGGGAEFSSHSRASFGGLMAGPPSGAYQQISNMGMNSVKTTRAKEKVDMQDLNERLANYIEKVRFLEAQNRKLAAELEQLRSKWGKETSSIKAMFETELATARQLLNEAEKGKGDLEIRCNSLQEEIANLHARLEDTTKQLVDQNDTVDRQNQQLSDYEAELSLLRKRVGTLEASYKKDKADIKRLQDDLQRAKSDLDTECLNRIIAENEKQSLQEELAFLKQVHEQEMKELSALAYRDTTAENREFWKNELSQCLHEIQAEYELKLDSMRGDTEAYYNAKMQEFRQGATRSGMETQHSKEEVKKLRSSLADLRARIGDLEARNNQLEKCNQDLTRELESKQLEWDNEKAELEGEITNLRLELETVLQELQYLLDAKLSLELEIAAYRKLLEGEETRIGLRNVVEGMMSSEMEMSSSSGGGGSSSQSSSQAMPAMKGEMSAKTTYQRSAKGNISICETTPDGKCVTLENTGRKDEVLDGWQIRRRIENKQGVVYTFPKFTLKEKCKIKIWGKGTKPGSDPTGLEMPDEKSWGIGANITTTLCNLDGEERGSHVQKTTYHS